MYDTFTEWFKDWYSNHDFGGGRGEAEWISEDAWQAAQAVQPNRRQDECLDILVAVIVTACTRKDGKLDSMAISAYANALRLLAQRGRVVIERDALYDRRVVARIAKPSNCK